MNVREAFDLLYSHPPETCRHCGKPKHSVKCGPQLAYERYATWELDEQRRIEAKEDSRRERDESRGDLMGARDWENE